MIRRVRCYVIECDDCRTCLGEELDAYAVHYDTHDGALAVLAQESWTVTEGGNIRCRRCTARAFCRNLGHMWDFWKPCECHGQIPAHATDGCPMTRMCLQCGHNEETDLAHLPTIDEPAPGC